MMLCGLILLYTLPAEPIVLGVVVLACLATRCAVRKIPSPVRVEGRNSRSKNLILSIVWLLVLIGALYDIALLFGPRNSLVATIENSLSSIPLLHFAERYRSGAALMNEPLPNLAGLCLSTIAVVSLAAACGFNAMGAEDWASVRSEDSKVVGDYRKIFRYMIGFIFMFFVLNAIMAMGNFSTSLNFRSYLFKMSFLTGPFAWSVIFMVIAVYGSLIVRDIELNYQLRKQNSREMDRS
jgi:hypothetical protein